MILGMPWIVSQDARINGPRSEMEIRSTGIVVRSRDELQNIQDKQNARKTLLQVSAATFKQLTKFYLRNKRINVFAASMADINKALEVKKRTDPRSLLPTHYHEFLDVFDCKKLESLPPLRGKVLS